MRRIETIATASLSVDSQNRHHVKGECLSTQRYAAGLLVSEIFILFITGVIFALMGNNIPEDSLSNYVWIAVSSIILFLLISRAFNLYNPDYVLEWRLIVPRLIAALLITNAVIAVVAVGTKSADEYSRVWFFSWSLVSLVAIVLLRLIVLAAIEERLARGAFLKRALIVNCVEGGLTGDQLALETRNRIKATGIITARDIESIPDLVPHVLRLKPDVVIFNLPWPQVEGAVSKFTPLSHYALEVLVLPAGSACLQKAIRLRRFGNRTLLQIVEPPLAEWDRAIKRVEDLLVASLALVMLAPLLVLVACAIKLESTGPVLFKQTRTGLDGDPFWVWKFRSMYVGASDPHASRQTGKNDPRVTRVGRFIRRTSIDELPQFWNVLQGHMSVVGPRPHALKTAAEGDLLETIVDEYVARHRVKPGITGWAQVNGARGELSSREQVKRRVNYDLYYIKHWSFLFDVKIILMTVVRVFYDPNAY
jgi:polysaccharide biosynthesis protein PslA